MNNPDGNRSLRLKQERWVRFAPAGMVICRPGTRGVVTTVVAFGLTDISFCVSIAGR
jgi:hypothetical protein